MGVFDGRRDVAAQAVEYVLVHLRKLRRRRCRYQEAEVVGVGSELTAPDEVFDPALGVPDDQRLFARNRHGLAYPHRRCAGAGAAAHTQPVTTAETKSCCGRNMGDGTKNAGGDALWLTASRCSWSASGRPYKPNMTSAIIPRPAPFTPEPWAR